MFLETLRGLLEPTRVREGCRQCELWDNVEEPGRYLLELEWSSPVFLGTYLESKLFRRLLVATDCLSERPRIFLKEMPGETDAETIGVIYEKIGKALKRTVYEQGNREAGNRDRECWSKN